MTHEIEDDQELVRLQRLLAVPRPRDAGRELCSTGTRIDGRLPQQALSALQDVHTKSRQFVFGLGVWVVAAHVDHDNRPPLRVALREDVALARLYLVLDARCGLADIAYQRVLEPVTVRDSPFEHLAEALRRHVRIQLIASHEALQGRLLRNLKLGRGHNLALTVVVAARVRRCRLRSAVRVGVQEVLAQFPHRGHRGSIFLAVVRGHALFPHALGPAPPQPRHASPCVLRLDRVY